MTLMSNTKYSTGACHADNHAAPSTGILDISNFKVTHGLTIRLMYYDSKQLEFYVGKRISTSPRYISRLIRLLRISKSGSSFGHPSNYYDLNHPIWCNWMVDWNTCNCGAFD